LHKISLFKTNDIDEALHLWYKNHLKYSNTVSLPNFLPDGRQNLENYFTERIQNEHAIILKENNKILGYFTWIQFDFHNEKSAFCPIIGHFGDDEYKEMIYTVMYNHVSNEWVRNDIFNHLWMIYFEDNFLKNLVMIWVLVHTLLMLV